MFGNCHSLGCTSRCVEKIACKHDYNQCCYAQQRNYFYYHTPFPLQRGRRGPGLEWLLNQDISENHYYVILSIHYLCFHILFYWARFSGTLSKIMKLSACWGVTKQTLKWTYSALKTYSVSVLNFQFRKIIKVKWTFLISARRATKGSKPVKVVR